MGQLANFGKSVGAGFSGGSAAPGDAANLSFGLGTAATGVSTFGQLLEGVGQFSQYRYAAQVARNNADLALEAGGINESAVKTQFGGEANQEIAAAAGRGVNARSGSPANVAASTREIGGIDAAIIHFNAAKEAYGLKTQADLDTQAAWGALTKASLGASSTLITGASSLADKWQQWQLSAGPGAGPPTMAGSDGTFMFPPELDVSKT